MESKEKIKNLLTENKELSTTRISGMLGIDYNQTLKLLNELLNDNLIEKQEVSKFTFWRIKNGV